MKHSLKDGGGYLEIDHRDSPGIDPDTLPPGFITAKGGERVETDVYQCSHCQRTVFLRATPGKMAERGYCPKCDHYICNACEALRVASGGQCVPFKQVLDRAANLAEKFAGQPDHPEAQVDMQKLSEPGSPKIILTDAP